MAVYILTKGNYERNQNVLVSTDVKIIAKKYVSLIEKGAFGDPFENPSIEIWNENDEDYPTAEFHEDTKNEKQLIKYLSKLAKQI